MLLSVLALGIAFTTMMAKGPAPSPKGDGTANGITVSGHAKKMVVPDTAYVSLGVVTKAKTSRQAVTENSKIAEAIIRAIEAQGIEKKDIQTQDYSLDPWVVYNKDVAKHMGYKVKNTVRVTVRDIKKVSDVADAGTDAGANSVQGVSFGVDNNEELNRQALSAAVENARKKAESVAKTLGVKVGEPVAITDTPNNDYSAYWGGSNYAYEARVLGNVAKTSLSPGQIEITQDVQVTFAVK